MRLWVKHRWKNLLAQLLHLFLRIVNYGEVEEEKKSRFNLHKIYTNGSNFLNLK